MIATLDAPAVDTRPQPSALADKQPRRVLMTTDTVGGVWTYSIELARELGSQGIDVALATLGQAMSPKQLAEAADLPHVEVFPSRFQLEWMDDPWADVDRAGDWLLHLAEHIQPDLIHLNQFCYGALPFAAPKVVVGHSCMRSWWRAVKGEEAPASWTTYTERVAAGLAGADRLVAPTVAMLSCLEDYYGPLPPARVIAHGRSAGLFRRDEPKEELVLATGRLWDEASNLAQLDSVADYLPWPVVVAGDTEHPENGPMPVPDAVRLIGRLEPDELTDWFARAAIYALPARYEPFGVSALEAALSGCALVLGDIPSLREVWHDAAVFVDPDSPRELRRSIDRLIARPDELYQLALRSHSRALAYTVERQAARYMDLYREVMGSERRARTADTIGTSATAVNMAGARAVGAS